MYQTSPSMKKLYIANPSTIAAAIIEEYNHILTGGKIFNFSFCDI